MIIFAADLFAADYGGGAELTLEALIEKCPFPFERKQTLRINKDFIDKNKDKFWVFGNVAALSSDLLIYAAKNINYSIIECDYKFCKYRLPELHYEMTQEVCNCEESKHGKAFALFHYHAKSLWWMSEAQKEIWTNKFPFFSKTNNFVLSSVFDDKTIQLFENFTATQKKDRVGVVSSSNWVKGAARSIDFVKKNKIEYELIDSLSYDQVLEKLSYLKGLVLMPNGGDTCPRITIEAKLLGCELFLNENVQHQNEEWFSDRDTILNYLKKQKETFWTSIHKTLLDEAINKIEEKDYRWSFAVPSYNEGERLRRFLKSCSQIRKYGLDDIFLINHRSSDNTEDILNEMKPILKECGIDLRWEYESQDFSSTFTMADLRMNTVNGCRNKIVHITDADNIVGKDFAFIVKESFEAFESESVYSVGYDRVGINDFIEFDKSGKITKHGPVSLHVPIPLWFRKDKVFCEQNHCGGRYYWFYPKDIPNPRWVTIPLGRTPSTILMINDKGEEWKKLRHTMNDFFEMAAQNKTEKSWIESYEEGLLEQASMSQQDYLHEDHAIDMNLCGDRYYI